MAIYNQEGGEQDRQPIPGETIPPQPQPQQPIDFDFLGQALGDTLVEHAPEIRKYLNSKSGVERWIIKRALNIMLPEKYRNVANDYLWSSKDDQDFSEDKLKYGKGTWDRETDDLPDTDILNMAVEFAISLYRGGYDWTLISDKVYEKFDIDWPYQKVKDIVLKNLAWGNPIMKDNPGVTKAVNTLAKKGIIRRFFGWLW